MELEEEEQGVELVVGVSGCGGGVETELLVVGGGGGGGGGT